MSESPTLFPLVKRNNSDYFNFVKGQESDSVAHSPDWPRLPSLSSSSPTNPSSRDSLPSSSSNSSRGSWSSLFKAGSVRQFVTGMQDFKDGLISPTDTHPRGSNRGTGPISVPKVDDRARR